MLNFFPTLLSTQGHVRQNIFRVLIYEALRLKIEKVKIKKPFKVKLLYLYFRQVLESL